jgi:threonine/homoserine/homoserine lactone efflux protein
MQDVASLSLVFGAYVLATASPGPSNMAIMSAAMRWGRAAGLTFAAGVICGSLTWAALAASGLSAALAAWAEAIFVIKIVGGLYLLWLAFKSARSAWRGPTQAQGVAAAPRPSAGALFRAGALMHLTNPKAILSWLAIMSLIVEGGGDARRLATALVGCCALAILVFGGYALIFSSQPAVALHRRISRWIDAALALAFGAAGLRLLTSRP